MPGDGCDIAVHLYEPGNGGLDRVAILLANGFAARGRSTELWLTRIDGPVADLIAPGVTVRRLPGYGPIRGVSLTLQIPALRDMIHERRPRVLLSAGNQGNRAVALGCRGTATRAIAKITNPVDRPGAAKAVVAWRRARFGLNARLADLTLTLSEADAHRYAPWFRTDKLAMVHNPYVTDAMLAIGDAREPRLPGSVPELVTVGRLAPQKSQATLLAALARLADRPWRLTLVGDGPLEADLRAQAAALGLADRVTFAGFTDPLPHMARADLFILSSRWEGLPAVALEALGCGLGLVVTDCAPGLREIAAQAAMPDPVPVGDEAALAAAIATALDTPPDTTRGRDIARRFTLDAAIDDHLRLMSV
ncbi:MAG: glycosyltransferase [Sphingopyxis sp.]|nr:glycosyltransferase [Sphingopyxis sp.]